MQLEREAETYRNRLPELAADAGKYVLIQGDVVVDLSPSYADALRDGYRRFGLDPFMVKRILIPERVHFIPRAIVPVNSAPSHPREKLNSVNSVDSV